MTTTTIDKSTPAEAFVDYCLILIIGILILGYSLYSSTFAEMAVFLPFIPFPVFAGEIVLIICLGWMAVKFVICKSPGKMCWNRFQKLISLFSVWILMKALLGFIQYGPLSLRNAALFYYFWVALITYYLLAGKNWGEEMKIAVWSVFLILLIWNIINGYYLWFFMAGFLALGINIKDRRIRYAAVILFAVFGFLKFRYFFIGSRSHLVSMVTVFLYLSLTITMLYWKKLKTLQKIALIACFLIGLTAGLVRFADRNQLISIVSPSEIIRLYNERIAYIKEREGQYHAADLRPQLYNPNVSSEQSMEAVKTKIDATVQEIKTSVSHHAAANQVQSQDGSMETVPAAPEEELPLRSLDNANGSTIFRLVLWRDMLIEMARERAIWGISFGKPQRSKSLEICHWALTEWTRDGWITPHNSFLHMVYRGGIVGFMFVVAICLLIIKLTKDFLGARSFSGLFLVSALMYWIVLSQFLVILELPYMAIPFWCLMGLTVHYDHHLKEIFGENPNHP